MVDETLLTTDQVLAYLKVDLRTVYQLIKVGKIPAVRVGRQWRFRKTDIDAWLDRERSHSIRPVVSSATPVQPARPDGRPRVLVVDDEASIRDLLSQALVLAEFDVHVAPHGQVALERMRLFSYELLITDLKMPGMDGLTVIHEARRLNASLPVIIITGFSTEASAIEVADLGVSAYLTKPFKVSTVLLLAARALGQ